MRAAALAAAAVAAFLSLLAVATGASASPLTARPQIALTFDDAPTAVAPLLLTLEQKQATATFFLVGEAARANPAQARAIADAGMLIGNHSNDHAHLSTATADEIRANLALAQAAILDETGVTPRWFRSPYLDVNPYFDVVLPELGLRASWPTINPKDWSGPTPRKIIDDVLAQAAPGGVVILHDMDNRTNTVEALPGLIDGLRGAGYDLVTLDDIGLAAVEGTVSSGEGDPAQGAVVTAYDDAGGQVASTTAGADGSYRLPRMAPGSYRVGVSAVGCLSGYYGGAELHSAERVVASADHTIQGADVRLEELTALSLSADPPVLPAGEPATVTVRLARRSAQGPPLPGQTVSLSVSGDGFTWSEPVGHVTGPQGSIELHVQPDAVLYYRADYGGRFGVYSPSTSEVVRIDVVTPLATSLTAAASNATPAWGKSATITGRLLHAAPGWSALPGQHVFLQTLRSGRWDESAETTTTEDGFVRFVVRPSSRTSYRLRYEGERWTYRPSTSGVLVVAPKAAVGTPVAPATMTRNSPRKVFGTLQPPHPAGTKPVRIYRWRWNGSRWRSYGYVPATASGSAAESRYSAILTLTKAGRWRLRAFAPADSQHAAAWSAGYDYVRAR